MPHWRLPWTSSDKLGQLETPRGMSTGPCWRGIHDADDDHYYDVDDDGDDGDDDDGDHDDIR